MPKKHIKTIVFTEPFPTVMVYKIAKLFKKSGYKTVLISLLENKGASKQFHKSAFDKIIYFNLSFYRFNIKNIPKIIYSLIVKTRDLIKAYIGIRKIKPYVLITRASPSWPCKFFHYMFGKTPWIYFPYDIRTHCFKTKQEAKKYGNLPNFEIKAEMFCFENADAVIHKGDPDELDYINNRMLGSNVRIQKKQLSFHPYASREFSIPFNKNKLSQKNGEIHVVHIDSMGSIGPREARYVYDTLSFFVNQKINIHIYSRPNSISVEEVAKFFHENSQFTKDYEKLLKSKYFHYHNPVEPNEIQKAISLYDFGLSPKAPVDNPNDIEPNHSLGNKLSSYIEAGIPLISHNSVKYLANIRDKYKVGASFNDGDKFNLKSKLKKINYKQLEKNIERARVEFSMEKNFPRLLEFVESVGKNK